MNGDFLLWLVVRHIFSYLFLLFYLREQTRAGRGRAEEEGETGSALSGEPVAGLDPLTPGSWPKPKADT